MPLGLAAGLLAGGPAKGAGGGIIPNLTAASKAESGGNPTLASDFIVGGTGRGTVPGWVWAVAAAAVAVVVARGRG